MPFQENLLVFGCIQERVAEEHSMKLNADLLQIQKDEEGGATPQAVEDTPVLERAAATAARPATARPKRAAAAAAQRAIAATAVKRQRGRRMSTASLASAPGIQDCELCWHLASALLRCQVYETSCCAGAQP